MYRTRRSTDGLNRDEQDRDSGVHLDAVKLEGHCRQRRLSCIVVFDFAFMLAFNVVTEVHAFIPFSSEVREQQSDTTGADCFALGLV